MLPGREEDEDPVAGSRSTDQLSNASSGYETGVSALRGGAAGPNTLAALLESVLSALDEPKGVCACACVCVCVCVFVCVHVCTCNEELINCL